MSITLLVANQKGGVGKTTLADELTFALERKGKTVAFMNLDPQGGAVHAPTMPDGTEDYQVVDTPGALNKDFLQWCKNADIIVIPVLPSMLDLVPFQRSYKLIEQAKVPKNRIGVVVNRFDERREIDREFMSFMENAGYPVWGTIPTATVFAKSNSMQTSVYELEKTSKATCAIENIVEKILRERDSND